MSQYAAGAMAESGMTYKEIIGFFYKNVEIEQQ
jgi:peptidoglycan hydrolase-like amidase